MNALNNIYIYRVSNNYAQSDNFILEKSESWGDEGEFVVVVQ